MKAAKWVLKDNNSGLVTVLCDDLTNAEETLIHSENFFKFSILRHTINSKRIGYKLEYNPRTCSAKKALFNAFLLVYSKKHEVAKPDLDLQVVYYDPVVRLFKYQHKNKKVADFLLIGRWRSMAEDTLEVLEEEDDG
jgi:hypothetical protein